jgi:hypothetical protein
MKPLEAINALKMDCNRSNAWALRNIVDRYLARDKEAITEYREKLHLFAPGDVYDTIKACIDEYDEVARRYAEVSP